VAVEILLCTFEIYVTKQSKIDPYHMLRAQMKPIRLAAAVFLATTTMAMAQEKVQISYSGVVSVAHLAGISDTNDSLDYFYGNGDVSFRWSTANDLKFGADLGIETFHILDDEDGSDSSAYYAAGFVEGRFGKVSIGMPRSVMAEYFTAPALAGSEAFESEIGFFTSGDIVGLLKMSESGEELYGARYDGKIGQIEVAAAAFRLSESSGHIEEIVARYDAGQWSVSLGTLLFEADVLSLGYTSLEVQGHAGKFSGGIVYSKNDFSIFTTILNVDSICGFVSYDVNEMIKLNTQVLYLTAGALEQNYYSFDLEYKNKTGAFINAGVFTDESFSDNTFEVSLGYKF